MDDTYSKRIPFGIKNGFLVDIESVESGLACECTCPSCGEALQANKGEIRTHYFSHDPKLNLPPCESAFETAIHRMAKQILTENEHAVFPELTITVTQKDDKGLTHSDNVLISSVLDNKFTHVQSEVRLSDIRPDIIAYIENTPILIEIAVTHFSDSDKVKKIRAMELSAIEIDLSGIDYTITKNELKELVISNENNKKWLSHVEVVDAKKRLKEQLNIRVLEINENYKLESRKESERRENLKKKAHQQKTIKQFSKQIQNDSKEYDPRWFVCESCRALFKKPLKEAPYSLQTITCKECGHEVSTKSPPNHFAQY